jgi:hypothetical protein
MTIINCASLQAAGALFLLRRRRIPRLVAAGSPTPRVTDSVPVPVATDKWIRSTGNRGSESVPVATGHDQSLSHDQQEVATDPTGKSTESIQVNLNFPGSSCASTETPSCGRHDQDHDGAAKKAESSESVRVQVVSRRKTPSRWIGLVISPLTRG